MPIIKLAFSHCHLNSWSDSSFLMQMIMHGRNSQLWIPDFHWNLFFFLLYITFYCLHITKACGLLLKTASSLNGQIASTFFLEFVTFIHKNKYDMYTISKRITGDKNCQFFKFFTLNLGYCDSITTSYTVKQYWYWSGTGSRVFVCDC